MEEGSSRGRANRPGRPPPPPPPPDPLLIRTG